MELNEVNFDSLWKRIQQTRGLVLQPNMLTKGNFVFTYNSHIDKVQLLTKLDDQFSKELSRDAFEKVWKKFLKIPWIDVKTMTVSPDYTGDEVFIAGIIRYYLHWW